nr:LysR family transcriptional regulator [uncultured Arthrobacter sp.]
MHELGGFTAAARSLHRAQSRISAHVASLESLFGEPLLNRDVHPPTLTAAGEAFLPHARGAIAEWTAAQAAVVARTGRVSGSVAVGSIPSVSSQILAPLFARFAEMHPEVTFEVHEGPNSWLDDALTHRMVELTIRPMIEEQPLVGIKHHSLLTDPFVVVLRRDHPLTLKEKVSLQDLTNHVVVTTGEAGFDARIGREYHQLLAEVGVDRERSMAVTQPTTVFAFVKERLGIGLIGLLAARMMCDAGLVLRPIHEDSASRQIGIHWARTRQLSPAASTFMRALRNFLAEEISQGRLHPPNGTISTNGGPRK